MIKKSDLQLKAIQFAQKVGFVFDEMHTESSPCGGIKLYEVINQKTNETAMIFEDGDWQTAIRLCSLESGWELYFGIDESIRLEYNDVDTLLSIPGGIVCDEETKIKLVKNALAYIGSFPYTPNKNFNTLKNGERWTSTKYLEERKTRS